MWCYSRVDGSRTFWTVVIITDQFPKANLSANRKNTFIFSNHLLRTWAQLKLSWSLLSKETCRCVTPKWMGKRIWGEIFKQAVSMFPPGGVCALFKVIFFHPASFILYYFLHPWYGGVLPKLDVKIPRRGEALLEIFWVNRSQEAGEATSTSVQAQVPALYCRLRKLDFS